MTSDPRLPLQKLTPGQNWKTTAAAVGSASMLLLNQFAPEAMPAITQVSGILAALLVGLGLHQAKDADG